MTIVCLGMLGVEEKVCPFVGWAFELEASQAKKKVIELDHKSRTTCMCK